MRDPAGAADVGHRPDQRDRHLPAVPARAAAAAARLHIVFQDPASSLNPRMSVADIVGEPLRLHRIGARRTADTGSASSRTGRPPPELGRRYPHELSGGQRQRVGLARALSAGRSLLVADEPTSALDVSVQAAVLNLIARLQPQLGFACLFVTHDLASVEFLAQRVAVMYLGRAGRGGRRRRAVRGTPRHPYTQALLSAAPCPIRTRSGPGARIVLTGEVPSPIAPPSGCRFHPRCPVAVPECGGWYRCCARSGRW